MENFIVLVRIGNRDQSAIEVQRVLTQFGKSIKVRLGLHDFDEASSKGLILLQVLTLKDGEDIIKELDGIPEVKVQVVTI